MKRTFGEKLFDGLNVTILLLLSACILIPLLHVLAGSLSSSYALTHSMVKIWPVELNFKNYEMVLQNPLFWNSLKITVIVVLIGTTINLALTSVSAYPLSKPDLRGRKIIMLFILFTMIFNAPIIPTYLVVKSLGMMNTIWSLIIPTGISAFNLILCITFFRNLPSELFDSAKVDGLSEYGMVWRIAVPLSMPIMVTLLLFYAVGHWNNYYMPLLYVTDMDLRTLQLYLYSLIAQNNTNDAMAGSGGMDLVNISPQGLQMATVVTATIPIAIVYPFLQRHFIKGALLGSVKG
ncbi:carbohydrate ABC transporter permease [Cohnella herbarum]|uniref:carbohydrate ABC transporter permease n=1 Tax=Cohnella herbarum TaxID=2728023 RepID=UPI0020C388C7|nr:carbohydrate ABC transporter permease [Cohnella herbarum]